MSFVVSSHWKAKRWMNMEQGTGNSECGTEKQAHAVDAFVLV